MKFKFKELLRSFGIGLIIFIIIILLNLIYGGKIELDKQLGKTFLYTILYSVTLGYANQLVFIYMDKVFINQRFSLKRMVVGFLTSFVITIFVIFLLRIFIEVIIEGNKFHNYWVNEK